MNTAIRSLALGFVLAAAFLTGAAADASAQTVITSLPYTITTKGLYVLNNDLSSLQTSGNLIEIKASNVTIDFQGHFISGPVSNTSQSTYGILANERSNLVIKNGIIAYCNLGIFIYGNGQPNTNAVGVSIDNMRVTYCYYEGIEMDNCPASSITNCKVSQIGYSGANSVWAIYCYGSGETIQNNIISNVTSTGSNYGISAYGCFARQNTISNAKTGIFSGKYQDNLTLNCTTPYSGGIDAGGNN